MARRQPRSVEIASSQDESKKQTSDGCPDGYYNNPGFPLFPAEGDQRWIRSGRDPSYVRIYKIIKGQPVLAEWFHGDPNATTAEVISGLWGKGTYKVQLMSSATPQRGIERIFQNTIEVDFGAERRPFPGRDRSPKKLANHGNAPVADDNDDDDDGEQLQPDERQPEEPEETGDDEQELDAAPGEEYLSEEDAFRMWRERRERQRRPSTAASLFGPRSMFQPPPAAAPAPQPAPAAPTGKSTVELIAVAAPVIASFTTMITAMMSDRAAREERAAQQQQNMMLAFMGRGDKITEKMLEVSARPAAGIDPHVVETLASIKSELATLKSRGGGSHSGGGDGLDQIEKTLNLLDKIKGPQETQQPEPNGGLGAILQQLGPMLPSIMALLSQQPQPQQPQLQQPQLQQPPPPAHYDPGQG